MPQAPGNLSQIRKSAERPGFAALKAAKVDDIHKNQNDAHHQDQA
jgi:hypothetical protein